MSLLSFLVNGSESAQEDNFTFFDLKSMVAGLQHDASVSKLKLLELERAVSSMLQEP